MPTFTATFLIGSLVYAFINFLRFLRGSDWSSAVTQVIAWVAGIAAVTLVRGTSWGGDYVVSGQALGDMNAWEVIVLGLLASSLFSPVVQVIKGLDNSTSSQVPPMVP